MTAASTRHRWYLAAGLIAILVGMGALIFEVVHTGPERAVIRAYTRLTFAAEARNLDAVRALCTQRFLKNNRLEFAKEGGLVGLPRSINKNFRAWRQGDAVWFCPTNRVGAVFQFLHEGDAWKYDGMVGLLRSGNEFVPVENTE